MEGGSFLWDSWTSAQPTVHEFHPPVGEIRTPPGKGPWAVLAGRFLAESNHSGTLNKLSSSATGIRRLQFRSHGPFHRKAAAPT